MPDELVKSILKKAHPVWEKNRARWARNEARLNGGEAVKNELSPFDWERVSPTTSAMTEEALAAVGFDAQESHYERRKRKAVYLPLPGDTAKKFVDTVASRAPHPQNGLSFGGLGTVRSIFGGHVPEGGEPETESDASADLSPAEMIWLNCDGTGEDGSMWETFWDRAQRGAMATDFRWIVVEEPPRQPGRVYTQADEQRGMRPYLIEYSPLQVPYWDHQLGTLHCMRVEFERRVPRVENGRFTDEPVKQHLLYVREGFTGFGERFQGGGWWLFDDQGDVVKDAAGNELHGTWEKTKGAIPAIRFYYERDHRGQARGGLDEIGAIAVGLMDLESAARYDAMNGCSGLLLGLGVTESGHKIVANQLGQGSKFIGVPADPTMTQPPKIHEVGSTSASDAVEREMERLLVWGKMIATKELTTGPDASGRARQVEYEAEVSPRLSHMAKMREEAQTTAIRLLEMRWGVERPSGYAQWPRRYRLESAIEMILKLFDVVALAGGRSRTLASRGVQAAVDETDLSLTDEDKKAIVAEIEASVEASQTAAAQRSTLADDLGI